MTYTYSEPSGGVFPDDRSHVRYLIGDTAPAAPFSLTDAEIDFELASTVNPDATNNIRQAAGNVAYRMSLAYQKAANDKSKSVGNLSISSAYAEQAAAFKSISIAIRKGYDMGNDQAAGQVWYDTTDVNPQFHLGQFDFKNQPGPNTQFDGSSGHWP